MTDQSRLQRALELAALAAHNDDANALARAIMSGGGIGSLAIAVANLPLWAVDEREEQVHPIARAEDFYQRTDRMTREKYDGPDQAPAEVEPSTYFDGDTRISSFWGYACELCKVPGCLKAFAAHVGESHDCPQAAYPFPERFAGRVSELLHPAPASPIADVQQSDSEATRWYRSTVFAPASPPGGEELEKAWNAGYGARPRELASERALREERDTLKASLEELTKPDASFEPYKDIDAANQALCCWRRIHFDDRARLQQLEGRIHGLKEQLQARTTGLDGAVLLMADQERKLRVAVEDCNHVCTERDTLRTEVNRLNAERFEIVRRLWARDELVAAVKRHQDDLESEGHADWGPVRAALSALDQPSEPKV